MLYYFNLNQFDFHNMEHYTFLQQTGINHTPFSDLSIHASGSEKDLRFSDIDDMNANMKNWDEK